MLAGGAACSAVDPVFGAGPGFAVDEAEALVEAAAGELGGAVGGASGAGPVFVAAASLGVAAIASSLLSVLEQPSAAAPATIVLSTSRRVAMRCNGEWNARNVSRGLSLRRVLLGGVAMVTPCFWRALETSS